MTDTKIEWTDRVWNPTTGCDKVSPGCDHCYALTMAKRLKGMGSVKYQNDGNPATSGPGFGFTMHPDALDAPLRWQKPAKVFVNSMSDLFHSGATKEFVAQVFAVMALTPQHTYQVLTKRPGVMRSWLSDELFRTAVLDAAFELWRPGCPETYQSSAGYLTHPAPWPLPNVWLGTSVEDQKRADLRIPHLLETPAAVRFLSMEPLLGPVDLEFIHHFEPTCGGCSGLLSPAHEPSCGVEPGKHWGIDWVIVGGESGPGARPMHPAWVRAIRDRCVSAGVPFHFKQWGEWKNGSAAPEGLSSRNHVVVNDGRHAPAAQYCSGASDLSSNETLRRSATYMARVGKSNAGRELDGRTWDEFPPAVTS